MRKFLDRKKHRPWDFGGSEHVHLSLNNLEFRLWAPTDARLGRSWRKRILFVFYIWVSVCHRSAFHWTWTSGVKMDVLQLGPKERNGDFLENSWNIFHETSVVYVDHRKQHTRLPSLPGKCHKFLGSDGKRTLLVQMRNISFLGNGLTNTV
jgi:hypothetical protein